MSETESDRDIFAGMEKETFLNVSKDYQPLPEKLFLEMVKLKIISLPVAPEQKPILKSMQWIWKDKHQYFIRAYLATLKPERRSMLVEMPKLERYERGIVSMLLKDGEEQETFGGTKVKKRTSIKDIQKLIHDTCHIHIKAERVKQLRQMAYDYKKVRASAKNRAILTEQPSTKALMTEKKPLISPELRRNIIEVFKAGLSVGEIARILGMRPIDIHNELVQRKVMQPIKESGKLKAGKVSEDWLDSFKKRGLTLEQWVQGWGFKMSNVTDLLAGKEVLPQENYDRIIHAIGRDLPVRFKLVFGVESQFIKTADKCEHTRFLVDWIASKNTYMAVAIGLNNSEDKPVECCGETASEAVSLASALAAECVGIKRLWTSFAIKDSWEDMGY